MATVINKSPNVEGIYRFLEKIIDTSFSTVDWERNPDISGVINIPRRFWKYDGTNVVVEMSQTEKLFVDASLTVSTNEMGFMEFAKRGRVVNTWLRAGGGVMRPSKQQPLILFNEGVVTGLTFSNLKNNIDVDILIYKNNVLEYTWEIRDSRYAYKTNGLAAFQFTTGDRISIYAKRVGDDIATWVMLNIQYRYTLQITGEGSAPTL